MPASLLPIRLVLLVAMSAGAMVAAADLPVVQGSGAVWVRHTVDNTSKGADGVKVGDLNRDGLPDLVTGWEEGGEVRAYLHPGHGTVREPWPRVTVGRVKSAEEAIFADLDEDGQLEVVSGTEGGDRAVYWHRPRAGGAALLEAGNWSTEAFPAARKVQAWMQALSFQVDGAHGPDLVLGSKEAGGAIGWLEAPAAPSDLAGWRYHPLRKAGWIMSLIAHDMDGDGDRDVIFTDRKGANRGAFWLENPGAESNRRHDAWREHAIGALGREAMFADLADVDGDKRLDLVVAVKPATLVLCFRTAAGDWREESLGLLPEKIGRAKAVKAFDVNGDGLTDLCVSCEGAEAAREGVVWLEQTRDGPWKQHSLSGPEGVKFDLMQAIDLDADGDLDVLSCEERDQLGVFWYENPYQRAAVPAAR